MTSLTLYNETSWDILRINMTADSEVQFYDTNILIILLTCLLVMLTVLGNALVMMAFIVDKSLRTQSNFFLLNLSICDFIIGAMNIPMYVQYLFMDKWVLGTFLCKIWLISDYMMCAASTLNVTLISYDRYLSVTKAILYRSLSKNHRQTVLKMVAVWAMAFLLYAPAILFWESIFGKQDIADTVCIAAFYDCWYFHVVANTLDFFIPLFSISYFNLSIYWNIRKRSRKKRQSSALHLSGEKDVRPYIIATNKVLDSTQLSSIKDIPHVKKTIINPLRCCLNNMGSTSSQMNSIKSISNVQVVQVINLSRDKNVAKSLAILVCIFTLCWAPYSFLISIRIACQGYCIPSYLYDATVWILYMNSAINPILYPLCHKSFQKAFLIILHKCM